MYIFFVLQERKFKNAINLKKVHLDVATSTTTAEHDNDGTIVYDVINENNLLASCS